jgi:hypothetical protein
MNAMRKTIRYACLFAACLMLGFVAFSQSGDDPLDALKVCPDQQKLIFENQFVRIIDDQVPVGGTEAMHHHPHGVVVYLADSTSASTTQDGKVTTSNRKANTAAWSEPATHSVRNVSNTASHAIRIDIKY